MSDLRYGIVLDGIEEVMRCIICQNPMHTDRGCDGNCQYNEAMYKRIMQELDSRIELLPYDQFEPHWIPVADRLPDNSRNVLITSRGGVSMAWYNGSYFEKGANTHHRRMQTVTAWCELPEPFKEVTE